jgi:hypothetical protein
MDRKLRFTAPASSFRQSRSFVLRPDTGSLLPACTRKESSARHYLSLSLSTTTLSCMTPRQQPHATQEKAQRTCISQGSKARSKRKPQDRAEARKWDAPYPTLLRFDLVESASAWEGSCCRTQSALEASLIGLEAAGVRSAIDSPLMSLR